MNSLSKIVAYFIAILLLFIFPIYDSFKKHDELAYIIAYNAVTNFVDSVRNKGYITPNMYNQFVDELHKSDYVFDIEMIHYSKVYNPIYSDPANPNTFQGNFQVDYEEYYSHNILEHLFKDNALSLEDESRKYKMLAGDYFYVEVRNKNRSKSTILKDFLTGGNTGDPTIIFIPYGGMIHNEDY